MFQHLWFAFLTGAPALCRWLKCGNSDVWGEWGNCSTSLLCQSWVQAFFLYIPCIPDILHFTRGSPWCT